MTPEQVSALSDNELNRAMIWLYPESVKKVRFNSIVMEYIGSIMVGCRPRLVVIDYLSDHNLTIPIALEDGVQILTAQDNTSWHTAKKQYYDFDGPLFSISSGNTNPLRAICECLVLIALADK